METASEQDNGSKRHDQLHLGTETAARLRHWSWSDEDGVE